ncbi:MFS transporter protein [Rutstroemia sp. NJR-2017a BVV2]|nr:MFS transporter protein [Rutstroemia sp. NJR-2017a BVV2]
MQDVELLPGTEILLHPNENNVLVESDKELELIPAPSDDPSDPLNWSPKWKAIVIVNQAIFVFTSVLTPFSITPLTPIFIEIFHIDIPQVNLLFGAVAIALGYANLVLVPFANLFGRRFVIFLCGFICIMANIWQALVTSYPSFIGARVLSGLGAAANESLMPMIVCDLMFLHQRGLWMGVYFCTYWTGLFIGPIISGSIASHISWRWFFWLCTILQGVNFIAMVFFAPETRFRRGRSHPGTPTGVTTILDSDKEKQEATTTTDDSRSKSPSISASQPQTVNNVLGTGKPSKAQFALIPTLQYDGLSLLLHDITAPIYIFTFPIILWASLSFGFSANCLLSLNLTQSQVFAAPPYSFSPASVGFINFAFFGGSLIGLLTAGPLSDWISMRATRRNGGIREPEMRLITLIPYIVICLIGMVVTGVGYQRQWPWEAIIIIGYGFIGIEIVGIPTIVIAYAVDCYKHISGEIMVTATIAKNTYGFGMIFFFNNWTVSSGYIKPIMTSMAQCVGITTVGMLIFMRWGKNFRRMTRDSKLHNL